MTMNEQETLALFNKQKADISRWIAECEKAGLIAPKRAIQWEDLLGLKRSARLNRRAIVSLVSLKTQKNNKPKETTKEKI